MTDERRLRELEDDRLWVAEAPQRFVGVEVGARMTVVRLSDKRLWVHSPIEIDDGLAGELRALGPIAAVVAPNRLHHLHVASFLEAFPGTPLYGSRALPDKRPDLKFAGVLSDAAPPLWAGQIDQAAMGGRLFLDEVAFCVRRLRTLILTDMIQQAHDDASLSMRAVGRVLGMRNKHAAPRDLKVHYRLDRHETVRVVKRIAGWTFDRLIVSHGEVVEEGGHDVFMDAYGFALR